MKIAIKGDIKRGNEVINILLNLGGKQGVCTLNGNDPTLYYWISNESCNLIICNNPPPKNYIKYTLEEFEKEFPFKIGDIVQTKPHGEPAIVTGMFINPATIIAYRVRYNSQKELHHSPEILKFYKEMKEKRNITLTLEKAKEWYNKGGELKEVALQAFSEKELNSFPRSWEEFVTNHARMGYYISADGKPLMCAVSEKISSPHVCPSKKSAEAHLAMIQLEQLRDCWWNGWEPEWNNCEKHVIKWEGDNLIVFTARRVHAFLVFPTKEMAEEFLECFRDLIEKARDLI